MYRLLSGIIFKPFGDKLELLKDGYASGVLTYFHLLQNLVLRCYSRTFFLTRSFNFPYLNKSFKKVFLFYLSFLSRTFRFDRTAIEGRGYFLTALYYFHPFHRHLDISRAIMTESSPLHIGTSQTWTGHLCFPSANC